jgi:hypothetical protein
MNILIVSPASGDPILKRTAKFPDTVCGVTKVPPLHTPKELDTVASTESIGGNTGSNCAFTLHRYNLNGTDWLADPDALPTSPVRPEILILLEFRKTDPQWLIFTVAVWYGDLIVGKLRLVAVVFL